MSAAAHEAVDTCASCGIAGGDDIELKRCTACKFVRYCSVECQRNHWPQHKRACKNRAAELRDERLFRQPESSYLGDCPICFIPLPLNKGNICMNACCSKMLCQGCVYASRLQGAEQNCPFCRAPCPKDSGEAELMMKKRIEANDPVAILKMGSDHYDEGDYTSAFKYYTKAAKLGNMEAHQQLGHMYREGKGVKADKKKAIHHWEEAAIGGHAKARYNLGLYEGCQNRHEKAMNHFIIAANQGLDVAVEKLTGGYKAGHVSKDDYAAALRAHQSAVEATKSQQRDAAK